MPPDPLILAFDTSAAHCAAALLCGDTVLAERAEPMATGQAERLFPLLEEMLAGADRSWGDLTGLGVGTGPGNFTGIRISVAAARGLALSLGIPAAGVSRFEVAAEGRTPPVRVTVPAPRDQVYLAQLTETGVVSAELTHPDLAAGHAPLIAAPASPSAAAIARIAGARIATGGDIPRPAPFYVRPPDAAPPRDPAPALLP